MLKDLSGQGAIKVGLIAPVHSPSTDHEFNAAVSFFQVHKEFDASVIPGTSDLKEMQQFDVLWLHSSDSTLKSLPDSVKSSIGTYLSNGGKLLLTLEAARFISDLGLESTAPEVRQKRAVDDGYGRKLGLHAFRAHAVFKGLNGGSYIFKPQHDTTVRIIGYFDDNVPVKGKVVAVDWDYIFLREQSKLMMEYDTGHARILSVGAYTCLSQPNINRQHLELFLSNCLQYLAGKIYDIKQYYWSYIPQKVEPYQFARTEKLSFNAGPWPELSSKMTLKREKSENQYWDVAGEKILVMGTENGGIEEVWAHPFMALRDYDPMLIFDDSIVELKKLTPEIEVRPASFRRIYRIGKTNLTETIKARKDEPICMVHYKFEGTSMAILLVKFRSNLRFMWPYSEKVLKQLKYTFSDDLNAFLIHAEDQQFNCLIGADRQVTRHEIGHYSDFDIMPGKTDTLPEIKGLESDLFEVAGLMDFDLAPKDEFTILISADFLNLDRSVYNYRLAIKKQEQIVNESETKNINENMLSIVSPDSIFNEGYRWALESTDRFFVTTPLLGSSLTAGYATTAHGWDGGQQVSGRPGYAWYFGRDGEWSGFALLDYGDFEKVKEILAMYSQYQDLNGKIYHEVSTSGIVHYDASDATPLYIILAGRYLRNTGDLEFIDRIRDNIQRAVDFCFSTDTDGDHLIENTNVGHGWVEGGGLFGSHSSLYLSSCWATALGEAAYIADAYDDTEHKEIYTKESEIVKNIINTDFWDEKNSFLYHGKLKDGSFMAEQSIMPAIPMYFGQVDAGKSKAMLPVFASDRFSSDWGCRIVSNKNKLFNPNGYHTGSVWPLFTGWMALAEYNNKHDVQGFTHLMNNLLVYRNWGLGLVEEVLNGETYKPSGVCHHQCWSETMVLQPAIEGMLGLETNALTPVLKLSPKIPADWDSLIVKRVRIGEHVVDFRMDRVNDKVIYSFNHRGPSTLQVIFDPKFESGTQINEIKVSGNFEEKRLNPDLPADFYIDDHLKLEYSVKHGIGVIPQVPVPHPDDSSASLKIISESLDQNIYTLTTEAPSGSKKQVRVFVRDQEISGIENGKIIGRKGNITTIELNFDSENAGYTEKKTTIKLNSGE